MTADRDKFEIYAANQGLRDFERNEFDDYRNPFTQQPWCFWKASRDALTQSPAEAHGDERTEFEAWAGRNGYYTKRADKNPERYHAWLTNALWDGWSGRATRDVNKGDDKPVAWMREGWGPDCGPYYELYRDDEMGWRDRKDWTPLYSKPQPKGRETFDEWWRRDGIAATHYDSFHEQARHVWQAAVASAQAPAPAPETDARTPDQKPTLRSSLTHAQAIVEELLNTSKDDIGPSLVEQMRIFLELSDEALQAPAVGAEPEANDWRLPADLKAGHVTFRKGVHCSTLVSRMKMLHETAFGVDNLTPEQKAENLAALQAGNELPHHFDPPPLTGPVAVALSWLDSAIRCVDFKWDADQKACAEAALRAALGSKPPVQGSES